MCNVEAAFLVYPRQNALELIRIPLRSAVEAGFIPLSLTFSARMPSYSDSFRIVCILILVLAWVTMALRYVARVQIMNLFRWDDAVATGSLVHCHNVYG
jgi:hypothetical protein